MKAIYIKPQTKIVPLIAAFAIMAGSVNDDEAPQENNLSRQQGSIWDEEEEEDDPFGGWFK